MTKGALEKSLSNQTLMRTSPALGGSTEIVSTERGCLGAHATAALHSITCPTVDIPCLVWSGLRNPERSHKSTVVFSRSDQSFLSPHGTYTPYIHVTGAIAVVAAHVLSPIAKEELFFQRQSCCEAIAHMMWTVRVLTVCLKSPPAPDSKSTDIRQILLMRGAPVSLLT
jgi:hypothetical protein